MTDEEKVLVVRSKLSGKFYVGQHVRVNVPHMGVLDHHGVIKRVENFDAYVVSGVNLALVYGEELRPA